MAADAATLSRLRTDAKSIFDAGLSAVDPAAAIERFCSVGDGTLRVGDRVYDLNRFGRIRLMGAGKAGAPMARALERMLESRLASGLITVKYGHTLPLDRVRTIEAGHPLPDRAGEAGARAMLTMAREAGADDLLLCVISGGGSALMPLPAEGLTLVDKQRAMETLLACGATIHEINTLRKHISGIKGGRLAAAAWPATVVTLIVSDVVGDDLDIIASGPTVADRSTFAECMEMCRRYAIEAQLPRNVMRHLRAGLSGEAPETPSPDHPAFQRTQNLVVARNMDAIRESARKARALGYGCLILSSMIEGETRHVARVHTAILREIRRSGHPIPPPACILSGGETTVTLTGSGRGGRNQEFALAATEDIRMCGNAVILSAGTDGTDGPTDAAGAVVDAHTWQRAKALGLSCRRFLAANDAYRFFEPLDDLFITGPTHTNVMDLRIALVV